MIVKFYVGVFIFVFRSFRVNGFWKICRIYCNEYLYLFLEFVKNFVLCYVIVVYRGFEYLIRFWFGFFCCI